MFQFNIISPSIFPINNDIVTQIFWEVEKEVSSVQNGQINIVFVTSQEIQNLNKTYRNKDTPTDVLSFHYFDDFSELSNEDIAWELIFCEEKIISQAKEYGLWEEWEFYKLLIHSLLHILWYDHEEDDEYKIMQEIENKIANQVFWKHLS